MRESGFPEGFFERVDERRDEAFYAVPRLVTHIDDDAIAAVGQLYDELGINGDVLDLMGSWVSHFRVVPKRLVVLGMNEHELRANPAAAERIVHDLNADPRVPLADESVDDVVCCASVEYFERSGVFEPATAALRTPPDHPGDPLSAVWSTRR